MTEIIEKKDYNTVQEHLQFLNRIKRCQINHIKGIHVVNKKSSLKRIILPYKVENDKIILAKIQRSIDFYSNLV